MNAKIKIASTTLLLVGALQQATALNFERDDTMRDSDRTYENVPVIIEENGRVARYDYEELTDAEKFLVQMSLTRLNDHLRSTLGDDDRIGKILTGPETTASFGCGFDSTDAEPFQFGCWAAGKVCYVSVGADGADFGCHDCNGTNCPTE